MPKIIRSLIFLYLLFCLIACQTSNQITKSNRSTYGIKANSPVDSSIIKTYLPYKTALDEEMNRVLGYSDVVLTKASKVPESVIGNFYADAVYNQVKKIVPQVDFVFPTTKGGIRNDIPKGPITVSHIFEMMPFQNQLVLFELKGTDVYLILKFIASSNGQPVAGITMSIQENEPKNVKIGGKAFDRNQNYQVVTSDFIAGGGDDSQGFSNPVSRQNIGLLVRDALLKEVAELHSAGRRINSKLDGRITKD